MPYDPRELFFKEIIDLNQDEPYYFSKRFKKAKLLLTDEEYKRVSALLTGLKRKYGLMRVSLFDVEKALNRGLILKVRTGSYIRKIGKEAFIRQLSIVDDELDRLVKAKANEIRFTGSTDFLRKARG